MLDRLPPEIALHVLSFLPTPDVYFCRLLCRAAHAMASPLFRERMAALAAELDSAAFAGVLLAVRDSAARGGGDCLGPEAAGRFLADACGTRADGLFFAEVSRRAAPHAAARGALLRGAGVRPAVLRAFVDAGGLLLGWPRREDACDFLLATGLPKPVLCDVVMKLQSASFEDKWTTVPLLQGWWTQAHVPEEPVPEPSFRAGLAYFFETAGVVNCGAVGEITYRWANGSLPAVVNMCPWSWHHRGLIVGSFAVTASDMGEGEVCDTIAFFLRRYFGESQAGMAVGPEDRRAFLQGCCASLANEGYENTFVQCIFFSDDLWPADMAQQASDYLGQEEATPELLGAALKDARGIDQQRIVAFFAQHPLSSQDYADAVAMPDVTTADPARCAAVLAAAGLDLRGLARVAASGFKSIEGDGNWFPADLSASDMGEIVAWIAVDQGDARADYAALMARAAHHLLTSKLASIESRSRGAVPPLSIDSRRAEDLAALCAFSSSFLRAQEGRLPSRDLRFAHLGAVLSSAPVLSGGTARSVVAGISRSFHLFGDVRSLLVGFAVGGGPLPALGLLTAPAWTWAFESAGFPPCMALEPHPTIRRADMSAAMKPFERQALLASLWDRLPLVCPGTDAVLCGVDARARQRTGEEMESIAGGVAMAAGVGRAQALAALAANDGDFGDAVQALAMGPRDAMEWEC